VLQVAGSIEVRAEILSAGQPEGISAVIWPRPHWCETLRSRTKKPGRVLRRSVGLVLINFAAVIVRSAADEQAVRVLGVGAEDFDLAELVRAVAEMNDEFRRTRGDMNWTVENDKVRSNLSELDRLTVGNEFECGHERVTVH